MRTWQDPNFWWFFVLPIAIGLWLCNPWSIRKSKRMQNEVLAMFRPGDKGLTYWEIVEIWKKTHNGQLLHPGTGRAILWNLENKGLIRANKESKPVRFSLVV